MRSRSPYGSIIAAALLLAAGLIALGGFVDRYGETGKTRGVPTPEPRIVTSPYYPFVWDAPTPTPASWESAAKNWAVSLWNIAVNWPTPAPPPDAIPSADDSALPPAKDSEPARPLPVPAVEPPPVDYQNYDMAASVFAYVNSVRAQNGLGAFSENAALVAAAQNYAQLLTDLNIFTHDAGGGLLVRARGSGYLGSSVGEAIWEGWGNFGADSVVSDWLNSPPHREILLGNFSEAGIACYVTTAKGSLNTRCVLDAGSP